MIVVVTGGNGMVGRNIQEALRSLREVVVLAPPRHELDLSNYTRVFEYFERHHPDFVIHAAGRVGGIHANIANPVAFLVDNMDITRNVILAAREAGVKRLLNIASSCMYPTSAESPLNESKILTGALEPTNEGYALAKIVGTRLCSYIQKESPNFEYKTMIPCNLFGRFDKFDPNNSHLLPAIIHKIHSAKVQNCDSVDIWGDGTARREFMYAGDLADAVAYALNHFNSMPFVMNVGQGSDHSVDEYYAVTAEVLGWGGKFNHDKSKPVGMRRKMVDVSAQLAWGWRPRCSLWEGLRKTYEYYLSVTPDH